MDFGSPGLRLNDKMEFTEVSRKERIVILSTSLEFSSP